MVTYLHRIVVEVSTVCFIGRSTFSRLVLKYRAVESGKSEPHYAAFTDQTISAYRNDYSMAWTGPSQVSSNDSATCDDGLAAKDDILRPGNCRSP